MGGAGNASSYAKCNVEYKWWGQNYGGRIQERDARKARRILASGGGEIWRTALSRPDSLFASLFLVTCHPVPESRNPPPVRETHGPGNHPAESFPGDVKLARGREKFGVFDDKWLDGDKLSLFPRDCRKVHIRDIIVAWFLFHRINSHKFDDWRSRYPGEISRPAYLLKRF